MRENVSPAARLLGWWRRLQGRPGGKWLFARILSRGIPYTGTVRPRVAVVQPGYARVEMDDRRLVRNHLNSIHALAIANVGELTTGLAMTATLPPDVRSILTTLHVEYKKKARGTLSVECRCEVPEVTEPIEYQVTGRVTDRDGDDVAYVTSTWKLAPPKRG